MEISRREKSAKNLIYAWLNQGVMLIMNIVVRMVFVRVLSKEYLGLSGLFGNIISLLSLAELGIGTAIIYSLYEPLASNDQIKINSLMKFYQKVYRIIGLVILLAGFILSPYLSLFIREMPDIPELKEIYILFVINSAISYFFSYKGSLITADQKDYIVKKIKLIITLVMYVLQVLALFITKNYILFLWIQIGSTLLQNILYTCAANYIYPFLDVKTAQKLDDDSYHLIFKNTKALIFHKIGEIVKFSTDNLIISKFVGLVEVGLYSNYTMIQQALTNILAQIFASITASVGNLGVTEDCEKKYEVFRKVFFLNGWIFGFCSIAFLCLAQDFIGLFFGESFILNNSVLLLIVLNFYLVGMRKSTLTFRDAFGLFWQNRYMPIAEAGINLFISLMLVKKYGIAGVLWGTALSTLLLPWWVEPYILFRYGMKRGTKSYWGQYWKYTAVTAGALFATWKVCELISLKQSLLLLGLKLILCVIIPNTIYYVIFGKTDEFCYYKEFLKSMEVKMMKGNRIHRCVDWVVAIIIIISLCYAYITRAGYEKIIRYAPMIGFGVLVILFFNHVKWMEKLKQRELDLILLIVGVVIAAVNLMIVKSGFGAIFNVSNFLLILYLADKVKFDKRIYYAIGLTCLLIFGTWIGKGDKTFNTNLASMILFALASFGVTVLLGFCESKQKPLWGKGISLLIMVLVVLPSVLQLRARCVLIGIAFFIILNHMIPLKIWKKEKLYNACVVLLLMASIVFPIWYVWFGKSGTDISTVILGKSFFSGRDIVWDQFLTAFYDKPLTGIGSKFEEIISNIAYAEVHNGLLHIVVVHGVFVAGIVFYLLGKRLIQLGKKASQSVVSRQCASVIISLAAVSIFENYFIITFYNIIMFLLFCIGMHDTEYNGEN